MSQWWKILYWYGKPGPSIPRKFYKTIRNESEVTTLKYLQTLPMGWSSINRYENSGGPSNLKGYKIKTSWLLKEKRLPSGELGLIAEYWHGLIGQQTYIKSFLVRKIH